MAELDRVTVNGHEYRKQYRKCYKCKKCAEGLGHGPYWYRDNVHYVGSELPAEILVFLDQLRKQQEKIKKAIEKYQKQEREFRQKQQHAEDLVIALQRLRHGDTRDTQELTEAGFASLIVKVTK